MEINSELPFMNTSQEKYMGLLKKSQGRGMIKLFWHYLLVAEKSTGAGQWDDCGEQGEFTGNGLTVARVELELFWPSA